MTTDAAQPRTVEQQTVGLLRTLIGIDSVNPALVPAERVKQPSLASRRTG